MAWTPIARRGARNSAGTTIRSSSSCSTSASAFAPVNRRSPPGARSSPTYSWSATSSAPTSRGNRVALEVFDSRSDVRNLFITPEIRARVMRFQPGEVSHGHTHDLGHEMFVVLAGQAEFTIAGESGLVGPGQICVARAGEWHEIRIVGDGPMTL